MKLGQLGRRSFLSTMLSYASVTLLLSLVWEAAQQPLYTSWSTAPRGDLVFAVIHCTAGDVIIATVSFALATLLYGRNDRPIIRFQVVLATIGLGLAYTMFSEWLNVYVRRAWAYSEWMPVLLGVGLSPLLQWLIVPAASLVWINRRRARSNAWI